jgi:hypothetical protein
MSVAWVGAWHGVMRRSKLTGQRLVAVFLAGVLLLNYPVIALFDRPLEWFGVPLLYIYLFGVWTGLIATMAGITAGNDE